MTLQKKSTTTATAHISENMYLTGFRNGLKSLMNQSWMPWKWCMGGGLMNIHMLGVRSAMRNGLIAEQTTSRSCSTTAPTSVLICEKGKTMREKLIELLYEAEGLVNNESPTIEMVADHLIANGVTFATDNNVGGKWIPVSERLPKEWDRVLVCTSANTANVARLVDKKWRVTWNLEHIDAVTHWMPLPEPPKEES